MAVPTCSLVHPAMRASRQPPPPPALCPTPLPCTYSNAYAARKNSPDKSWQEAAYTDEIAHLQEQSASNGNGDGQVA